MTLAGALLLALAGVGAGLTGSVAGLASLVSYPALLATGLPPLAANVTNTVSMLAGAVGAAVGSRPELRGQPPRLRGLMAQAALGGVVGAGLLLAADESVFELVVPWLVAFGAVLAAATVEPLAVTNAVKNVVTGTANVAASVTYVFLAPVHWPSVLCLGTGALLGSWLGPRLVRVLPERPLRYAIGAAGLGLATHLALS